MSYRSVLPVAFSRLMLILMLGVMLLAGCSSKSTPEERVSETLSRMSLKDKIAQKIILDFRYFCSEPKGEKEECRTPMQQVPAEVAGFLERHALGGVILFADNIDSIEQTVRLTHGLQRHSLRSPSGVPLLISIDQEGGKVARLPGSWATNFAGNMAISATPPGRQNDFARKVGAILGAELMALGINVNHAPVVDINTNRDNPVINVRSFSDQPEKVTALAGQMAQGMMDSGVISTLKHFPGHGDTALDSHLAVPQVGHDRARSYDTDLWPFARLIAAGKAPMIMTAHIQFPALDGDKITAKDGSLHYAPATLSKKMLTGILRHEFGYDGVIVSDAMNMKAISSLLDRKDAMASALKAGIDLLLMPVQVQSARDLEDVDALIEHLARRVEAGEIREQDITHSVRRILRLKEEFNIRETAERSLGQKIIQAEKTIGTAAHRDVERKLAVAAITALKTLRAGKVVGDDIRSIHVIMPTEEVTQAFLSALRVRFPEQRIDIKGTSLSDLTPEIITDIMPTQDQTPATHLLITGHITPAASPVDLGGMGDVNDWQAKTDTEWRGKEDTAESLKLVQNLHRMARMAGQETVFISLRFPTDILSVVNQVDAAYAIYNYNTVKDEQSGAYSSPSINALVQILAGDQLAQGHLPIQLEAEAVPGAERLDLVTQALAGKRAGLIVNPSSRVEDRHLIDVLQAEGVAVTKLFAVEHGIRGTADAGAKVDDGRDSQSGLPILSIYGKKKSPSAEDTTDLDVLVFDLQDVGVRFYTYLSSLHYVMDSCARNKIPLVLLDRPNPNGAYIDGPILQPAFQSFVGMHPIPLLHGMTLGELARMINGEGWLPYGATCDLTVIPVQNYTHATDYILPVKPSPNLPNQKAIKLYPSLALFEATTVSVGRGTDFPFQVLGGVRPEYGGFQFTPVPKPGAALDPKLKGQQLFGRDFRSSSVTGLNIEILIAWYHKAKALEEKFLDRPQWLDKLMGTDLFRRQIEAGLSAEEIRLSWKADLDEFKARRTLYLLYPDEALFKEKPHR
ncbi:glycoside hydrolase family 3 N-terminal domain-containing protein [Paremcibacter congregatus]|uniref:beta-N-acetylhexosaminidase n=1 Tax=Paremcibacter congregatus TaxID=2043170 RepID=A0A2G4YT98_9PROT|nr:glycoside hydrolase family 3 N-terminal domain-containing protein [Paremcibacter congregatus]PHZ84676.1 hypothetical protein CRD36_10330 [Paremcibacter congregatus]QDE28871.1 DUF1343 domain-containing protein [Paremcibacter congregatus]